MYFARNLRTFAFRGADVWCQDVTGLHSYYSLQLGVTRETVSGFRHFYVLLCNSKESIMALGSDKKTYAEAVTCSTSFGVHSWSHLQTQDEEKALFLAIQKSLSSTLVANI